MIDPLKVFRIYVAVKLHFTDPKYDFMDKKGAIRANSSSLEKRKDKAFFESAARWMEKESDCLCFFVSNFIDSPDQWIGDLVGFDGKDAFQKWKTRFNNLEGELAYDIANLRYWMEKNESNWDEFLTPAAGYPMIFRFYRRKMILPETWTLINRMTGFCDTMRLRLDKADPIWVPTTFNLDKYSRFLVTVTAEKYGHLIPELRAKLG